MPEMPHRNIPSTQFAVIREYQPSRIERELLAQVFEVAERGCSAAGVAGDPDHQVSADQRRAGDASSVAADSSNLDGQTRANLQEAVA